MTVRTKLIGIIVLGAALLVPVAQAERPDDQAGARGPGAVAAQDSAATHPDNRAGIRGPGAAVVTAAIVRPDDRAGARGPGAVVAAEGIVATHPDNRPERRGPGSFTSVTVQPVSDGFDWGDALIGGLGGAGMALLLTGAAFLLLSQRIRLRTA